jgi:copper(I)-binding protein
MRSGVFVALLLASAVARADLIVEGGHVRALPPGVANTSAYMTLKNPESQAKVLISVSSPAAARVTLHSTMNHNGMLHMQHLDDLTIPAGGSVALEAGGTHLMLEELAAVLEPGSEVELVLVFADGQQETITLPVKSVLDE